MFLLIHLPAASKKFLQSFAACLHLRSLQLSHFRDIFLLQSSFAATTSFLASDSAFSAASKVALTALAASSNAYNRKISSLSLTRYAIASFHCQAIKKEIVKHQLAEAKNFKFYKRLTNKQLFQVVGLCGTLLVSYLPKRSTQFCRAQYGDAMLVPLRETAVSRCRLDVDTYGGNFENSRCCVFYTQRMFLHLVTIKISEA